MLFETVGRFPISMTKQIRKSLFKANQGCYTLVLIFSFFGFILTPSLNLFGLYSLPTQPIRHPGERQQQAAPGRGLSKVLLLGGIGASPSSS